MPIILAAPFDHVEIVMGLVSLQHSAAMVAIADPETDVLHFLWVSMPCPNLQRVEAYSSEMTMEDFVSHVSGKDPTTFRVKYWEHSAVTYGVPACIQVPDPVLKSYRFQIAT